MGVIRIQTVGSFQSHVKDVPSERVFSALGGGHAQAVAAAITFLSEVVLPRAIEADHRLHDAGDRPARTDFSQERRDR